MYFSIKWSSLSFDILGDMNQSSSHTIRYKSMHINIKQYSVLFLCYYHLTNMRVSGQVLQLPRLQCRLGIRLELNLFSGVHRLVYIRFRLS